MNQEMRLIHIERRRAGYNKVRKARIRHERESLLDSLESAAAGMEFGVTAGIPLDFQHDANAHWVEAHHRHGIPLVLAIRGLAVKLDIDRDAKPPVLLVTRQDPEHLDSVE